MLKSDTARRFREARWAAGLSRREVAEKTNGRLSEQTVVNVEKDGYSPLPQTVYILAEALGLDPKDFFSETEVAS